MFKEQGKIFLDGKRKKDIRDNLIRFMKQHPSNAPSQWWQLPRLLNLFSQRRYQLAMASLLLLLLGGEYLVAANVSMPGDLLYPVKLGFNEQIKGVISFSDEEKSKIYIELAEKRLLEAEQIEYRDEASSKNSELLEKNFAKNSEKAIEAIKRVESKQKKEEIATKFEESLIIRHNALTSKPQTASSGSMRSLSDSVERTIRRISEIRSGFNIEGGVKEENKAIEKEEVKPEKEENKEEKEAEKETENNSEEEKAQQPNQEQNTNGENKNEKEPSRGNFIFPNNILENFKKYLNIKKR